MKLYSAQYIAAVLDLSERRVRQLRDEGVIEEQRKGYYDLRPTIHAYLKYLRSQISDQNHTSDYNTERARLVRAKRERQELDLELQRGDAHSTEVVEAIVTDMIIRFKTRMLSIPHKISPALCDMSDANDISDLLTGNIREALEELADFNMAITQYEDDIRADTHDYDAENE